MKPFMQEFIVGFILVMVLVIFTIGGLSNMHDAQELVAGLILLATLIVFTLGKSPVFRVDRAVYYWCVVNDSFWYFVP